MKIVKVLLPTVNMNTSRHLTDLYMDLSSSIGAGGHPHLQPQYGHQVGFDGGIYQMTAPPLLLHSAPKLSLYPGLVMPTVYPHQALIMPPNINTINNINTIGHLPNNYLNILQPPHGLNTGPGSQVITSDEARGQRLQISNVDTALFSFFGENGKLPNSREYLQ